MSGINCPQFKDLLLTEENINAVLLSAKGDCDQLIEYLILNIQDKRELLAKLKILALHKKIKCRSKLEIEPDLCDEIMINIFAAKDFKKMVIPHDIIKILSLDSAFNRKISKWYFMNRELNIEMSDKIIEYIIRFSNRNQEINLPSEKNVVLQAISSHEMQFSIDISTVPKEVLQIHDGNIRKQLKLVSHEKINYEMLNRCVDIIKILIARNKTKNIKLFRKLHDLDTLQKINYKNNKIGPLLKMYFKNLIKVEPFEVFRFFIKMIEKEPDYIKYTNHIYHFIIKTDTDFPWKDFFKTIRKNKEIKQLDLIDFQNIPAQVLFESVYKDFDFKRYKNIMINVIKNEIDQELLNLYCHKFSKKDHTFFSKICKHINGSMSSFPPRGGKDDIDQNKNLFFYIVYIRVK